ncbi:MAG: SH3 domain-containing protein [Clostridia bacterium]|nr:SH3 domain-containing protein [Clostridia bacterium]
MKRLLCSLIAICLILSLWVAPVAQADDYEYRTWLQSDSRWGSISFSSTDTISKTGCALTSIAKLLVHSGAAPADTNLFNPGIYCEWLKANGGFYLDTGWIIWSTAANYSPDFSYHGAVTFDTNASQASKTATIASYINDGYVVVVQVKNGGHYVAVDKVENGRVYIMDSAANGPKELFGYANSGVTKLQIYKGPHNGTGNIGGTNPSYFDTTIDPISHKYTITSDNGVNLRAGIGTSYDILTAIPYNATITVTEIKNGWGKTTYDGETGWCTLDYAKAATPSVRGLQVTPPTKTDYLIGETLAPAGMKVTVLYSDGTSKVITSGYTVSGLPAQAVGTQDVYVTYQGKSAKFTVSVTKKEVVYQIGTYVITSSDGLNLRAAATTDSSVLTAIETNTRVTVTLVQGNWGKITYDGKTGWICLDYTKLVEQAATPTEIRLTPKKACILTDTTLTAKDFTALLVYSDGSTEPLTEFTLTLGDVKDGMIIATATNGTLSASADIKVFDSIPMGDCDFDGKVAAQDALSVLKQVVGKEMTGFYKEAADVNGDGQISASDALMILQKVVGKIPAFPTPEQAA